MKKPGRPKEVIKFLTIKEIMKYAEDTYPDIAFEMGLEGGRENVKRKIESTLIKHHLISEAKSDPNKRKVSETIAYLVVDTIIYDYYKNININQNKLDKIKKHFQEMDKKLNDEYEKEFINNQAEVEAEEIEKEEAKRNGISLCMHETPNTNVSMQNDLQKHLPILMNGGHNYTLDFENKVVDGVIPFFFDEYYYFNEKEFRKDLQERAWHIDSDDTPRPFMDGYSELTWKLDHPISNYIFPKKAIGHYMFSKKSENEED